MKNIWLLTDLSGEVQFAVDGTGGEATQLAYRIKVETGRVLLVREVPVVQPDAAVATLYPRA